MISLTDAYPRPISDVRHVNHGASPPVVYRDIVVVGSSIPDRYQMTNEPPGIVQGFDARTGKRLWVWNAIPQSPTDFGAETWEEGSWRFNGHANVWGPMVVDATRGLIYFGTSTPGNDYYGGRRPGKNEPAESIVCLDANTGQRKWSFQMVHHGLWDFDNPAAPNLVTITVDGKRIDAVAQVTKQGFTYVFDRVSGEPVWPIVERPVSTETDVPGEKVWPTQPFPTKPPAFARQGVSLDDANDLTPEIKELAQAEMKNYRLGPLFTPPSLRGTLQLPGNEGGANWGGAIWDAQAGRLYVRSKDVIRYNSVTASDGTDKFIDHAYSGHLPETRPGTRLGAIPLIKPPYAQLTAIDLNKGDIALAGAGGRGEPGDPQSSAVEGRETAGPSGFAGQRRRDSHRQRIDLRRWRRRLPLRLRQDQRPGAVARQAAVCERREHDDLPHACGPAVRAGVHRRRARRRARRLCSRGEVSAELARGRAAAPRARAVRTRMKILV